MHVRTRTAAALAAALAVTAAATGAIDAAAMHATSEDAGAAAESPDCSNRNLRGEYAFTIDGTILAGPTPLLLRGLAMTRFDGEGGLTQVDFATLNGVPGWPDWRPVTGTYEVDADCTGRAELVPPAPAPSFRLRLVVFDRGRQVATIVEGNATGSLGVKVR
jgi:hypothetical protein